MQKPLLNKLGIKKRNEIRRGKLWEILRFLGIDVYKVERIPPQPEPMKKPEAVAMEEEDKKRTHTFMPEDNVTNMTKKPELL